MDSLAKFLDPITGGSDGKGWALGKTIYPSDVIKVFFEIEGIDHIDSVIVRIQPDEIDDHNEEIVYLFNNRIDKTNIKNKIYKKSKKM